MTDLHQGFDMPVVRCKGATDYGEALDPVRARVEIDVDTLTYMGMEVLRPVMFLSTDGAPTDPARHDASRRPVDPAWRRHRHLFTHGFGAANPPVLARMATRAAFPADPG